ncbi:MAG: hypothetical protein P8K68_08690 [Algibacter sp.]|uniref:hypothetical protein n=1 Tax=Algibacter sp. TaxID=1872428 RepID=UPI00262C6744|nr:hypothetical protein [Algibacter sp.]MDG1730370.1 hypothetical protein [Algibacter sp.]MDG2178848.1 hypothetical protein [Algibacter sp.]
MYNLRKRPKGNYIQNASWEALYLLLENWKTDLEFYFFDIKFLNNLVENHFSELLACQNLDELRELQMEVFELQNQCEYILACIQNNRESIIDIINNNFPDDTSKFRVEIQHLEDNIEVFIDNERELRRNIFIMIKEVFKSKKSKNVWLFN